MIITIEYLRKHIDLVNELINAPRLYVSNYFEDIKNEIDLYYAHKFNENDQNKVSFKTEYQNAIDLADRLQRECLRNSLSFELKQQAIYFINQVENEINSNTNFAQLFATIQKQKSLLESCLLVNRDGFIALITLSKHNKKCVLVFNEAVNPELIYFINNM